jgi:hypothetical protein
MVCFRYTIVNTLHKGDNKDDDDDNDDDDNNNNNNNNNNKCKPTEQSKQLTGHHNDNDKAKGTGTCMLVDVELSGDRYVIKEEAQNI